MPDPILYLQSMGAAFAVSVLALAAGCLRRKPVAAAWKNAVGVIALALGLVLGWIVLKMPPEWPPGNALARLLWLVLPLMLLLHLLATLPRMPAMLLGPLHMALAVSIGWILLHGSIYLDPARGEWTTWQAVAILAVCALLLVSVWERMLVLSRRSGISLLLVLAEAALCTGAVVMLGGYTSGGAAALPLGAALAGCAAVALLIDPRDILPGVLGIGVVALFGLLFIGRFFGGLSTMAALVVFLSPLLAWIAELPPLSRAKFWQRECLRLILVAIPLAVVLVLAKQAFDRDMGPLL